MHTTAQRRGVEWPNSEDPPFPVSMWLPCSSQQRSHIPLSRFHIVTTELCLSSTLFLRTQTDGPRGRSSPASFSTTYNEDTKPPDYSESAVSFSISPVLSDLFSVPTRIHCTTHTHVGYSHDGSTSQPERKGVRATCRPYPGIPSPPSLLPTLHRIPRNPRVSVQ